MKLGTTEPADVLDGLSAEQIRELQALAILDGWYLSQAQQAEWHAEQSDTSMTPQDFEAYAAKRYG